MDWSPFHLNCQDGCKYVNKLVEIFKTGVVCDYVQFEDDDRTSRCLWYCSVHDEESNKYRPSSLHSKMSIVTAQYERYKTYEETKKQIVKALGTGKSVTVGKWIRAHKQLHSDVKAVLSRQNVPVNQNQKMLTTFLKMVLGLCLSSSVSSSFEWTQSGCPVQVWEGAPNILVGQPLDDGWWSEGKAEVASSCHHSWIGFDSEGIMSALHWPVGSSIPVCLAPEILLQRMRC